MFPSTGYFRGINCPFYINGLCERPYCHFRHSRVEEKPNKSDVGPSYSTSTHRSYSAYTSSSNSQLNVSKQDDIASYSTGAAEEPSGPVEAYKTSSGKDSSEGEVGTTCAIPSFSEPSPLLPESNEEPVKYDSLPKISGLPRSRQGSGGSSGLPSYVPTPKTKKQRVQLKVKESVPSYQPTPKQDLNCSKKKAHTIEYDPVKNFTFREKVTSEGESDGEETRRSGADSSSEARSANGVQHEEDEDEEEEEEAAEGAFSDDDENDISRKVKTVAGDDDLTDSDEDVSGAYVNKSASKDKLPSYAELLTPSSYFTSKVGSPSDSSTKSVRDTRKYSTDSNSSSVKGSGRNKHKSSSSHSTHKSHSSKSGSKSQHHSKSDNKDRKSHHLSSSSKSSSSTSKESGKSGSSSGKHKSSAGSSHHKSSSSSAIKRQNSESTSTKSHDKVNSSSSSKATSSSHSDHKDSSKDSPTHSSSRTSERGSSSTSEKENRHSSKHKSSGKPSSTSSSNTGHSSHQRDTDSSSHRSSSTSKSVTADNKSHSHKDKHSVKCKDEKHRRHSSSSTTYSKSKHSHSRSPETKVKLERKGSISQELQGPVGNGDASSHTKNGKDKSWTKHEDIRVKQERRNSDKRKSKGGGISKHRSSTETSKVTSKRHISDVTSDLFGDDGGSGSDSDVQIVEVPPPPVYELSESEEEAAEGNDEHEISISSTTDDVDLLSDSDTFDECLRIFQESERQLAKAKKRNINPDQAKMQEEPKVTETSENLLVSLGKKRMAHTGANQISRPVKAPVFSRPKLSPAEVMHNRIVEMQKRALLRAAKREGRESELPSGLSGKNLTSSGPDQLKKPDSAPSSSSLSAAAASLISTQRKREAHTPVLKTPTKVPTTSSGSATWSPNSFYNKTKKAENLKPSDASGGKSKLVTVASTASKTEKRKAHEPTQLNLKRPIIPAEYGAKVPSNIRQRYLNLIIDEYLKFNPEETAFTKGQEEEQAVYGRASNKNIYLRLAVNTIKRIRTEAMESQPSSSKKLCTGLASMSSSSSSQMSQSHFATLGGSKAAKTSFTLHRSGSVTHNPPQNFKGRELYDRLKKYILTEEQLRENGFPRPSEDGTSKAKIYKEEQRDQMLKDNERNCKRCGKRFYVDKEGTTVTVEQCVYHYGNAYKKKVAGSIDSRYACCNERAGARGCQVAKCHVHERNKTDNLTGYMKTMPDSPSSEKNYGIFSLDCEMVYTKAGLELARVTVVAEDNTVKYETLVKPDTEILDYNTRFSGITESDMKGVTTTLRGVQAVLLSMFSDKTILIGHSLESDLQSLKLIHSTVVDTSLVFPHRLGLPFKRALRNLMVEYLQKIIQADDGGHDSKEDAVACMQLMLYKIKEDAKKEVRRV